MSKTGCDFISREAAIKAMLGKPEDRYFASMLLVSTRDATKRIRKCKAADVAPVNENTSDGYHTFKELYHHRAVLFAALIAQMPEKAWKSKTHSDGSVWDGWFIVGIETPEGQATYHYASDPYWDMFCCHEVDRAPEWDGHTPEQAIERIMSLIHRQPNRPLAYKISEVIGDDDPVWIYRWNGEKYSFQFGLDESTRLFCAVNDMYVFTVKPTHADIEAARLHSGG
jgi:hypothetical protein